MGVRVKICGLTRPEDAAAAGAAGAAYLGVVFAGGPRAVSAERARTLVAAAAGVPVLGVFGREPPDEILRCAEVAALSGVQLHGDYPRSVAAELRARGLLVWRVVRIAGPGELDRLEEAVPDSDAVLVEPRVAYAEGGSGVPLAPEAAIEARRRLAGHPMVLAGGLTPGTVAEAVALVRPDVVDVSSGVEQLPGLKDPGKIARFVEAALGFTPIS